MEQLCFGLLDQLKEQIRQVEKSKNNRIQKTVEKINTCQKFIKRLRPEYLKAGLDESDQINFFKTIKPQFYSELYFQKEVLMYYRTRPAGPLKALKTHINHHLDRSSVFILQNQEFFNYMELKLDHLDQVYFTDRPYDAKLHSTLEYPMDPDFSSPADATLSNLLSVIRFQQFLKNEMFSIKTPTLDPSWESQQKLTWQGSKTDLVELIYALSASETVKNDLNDIAEALARVFNVDIGNFYRTYADIKYKKNTTSFLDMLKTSLLEKIRNENEK